MTKYRLRITNVADQDLDDLYFEGLTQWGEAQADRYFDGLIERLDRICETPMQYPSVDHIRQGYRRSIYEKHSIYYRIVADTIEIHAVVKYQDIGIRL